MFLQNTTGYMIGRNYEMEGITKDGAKMLMAQAGSEVPKFTVITSAAFGAGYCGMCGRAWDPRMIWAWPNMHMGVMGPDQAANTLADVKIAQLRRKGHAPDEAEMVQFRQRVCEKAERESNAYFAATHWAWRSQPPPTPRSPTRTPILKRQHDRRHYLWLRR